MADDENNGSEEILEMFCELCKKKGKHRTANRFCVACVRYFCAKCALYHTEFLPDHVLQDETNMPQDICLNECPEHSGEIIKFYCSSCDTFFCELCRKKDHGNCLDVSHLPLLVDKIELGNEFKEFQQKLDGFFSEVYEIESVVEKDKELIEEVSEKALTQIETSKQELLERLTSGFNELKKEVETMKNKDEQVIERDLAKITEMKAEINDIQLDAGRKSENAKKCELFMAMKNAASKLKSFQGDMTELKQQVRQKYELEMTGDVFGKELELGKFHFENLQYQNPVKEETELSGKIDHQAPEDEITNQLNEDDEAETEDCDEDCNEECDEDSDEDQPEECLICSDRIYDHPYTATVTCGHALCEECIENGHECPVCGEEVLGDQPDGSMTVTHRSRSHCAGYTHCGQIVITYKFPSGQQGDNHPSPGSRYQGIRKMAYLPDNDKGRQVLAMLKIAFERKLIFTIGTNKKTGEDGIIWNGIHHKVDPKRNAKFGYPDPAYLDRVTKQLAKNGVTPADCP